MKTLFLAIFVFISAHIVAQYSIDSLFTDYKDYFSKDSSGNIFFSHSVRPDGTPAIDKASFWIAKKYINASCTPVSATCIVTNQRLKLLNPVNKAGIETIAAVVNFDIEISIKNGSYIMRSKNFKTKKTAVIPFEKWIIDEFRKNKSAGKILLKQFIDEIQKNNLSFEKHIKS